MKTCFKVHPKKIKKAKKILNCISDLGAMIPIMTKSFWENGMEYSCTDKNGSDIDNSQDFGSGEGLNDCYNNNEQVSNNFLISCSSKRIIACIDKNGDTLKEGFFLMGNNQLKFCRIYNNGKKARIESRGCFIGKENDDVMDESLHVKKYKIWRSGDYDMRCGENGVHVYRCHIGGNKSVYAGSAWIDSEQNFNVCY
ncbi:unnamed protein product [Dracunculus medinensis]|uniref:Ricin B-type lectin domain-containing protein n=1 Tax=Dracunculus medinensis TaxID=318479 RepID=A0A0N4UNG7_DRAME|nr:unnamed protein product [Dracunculus medinensis]